MHGLEGKEDTLQADPGLQLSVVSQQQTGMMKRTSGDAWMSRQSKDSKQLEEYLLFFFFFVTLNHLAKQLIEMNSLVVIQQCYND